MLCVCVYMYIPLSVRSAREFHSKDEKCGQQHTLDPPLHLEEEGEEEEDVKVVVEVEEEEVESDHTHSPRVSPTALLTSLLLLAW